MSPEILTTSVTAVRRLAVTKQRLGGRLPSRVTPSTLVSVVRDLAFVQWDPVTTVAPSHLLSFWARVGDFRTEILDRLLWKEKSLFLHWTPIASIVLSEDYPLYLSLMKRYPESLGKGWGSQREDAKRFLASHAALRRRILSGLKPGPRTTGDFKEHEETKRDDGDWGSGSDLAEMLFHLLMRGEIMVVGHRGAQNLWGLTDEFLPGWVNRDELSEADAERAAAQRAIRALGTATPREITLHFPRGRYAHLKATLADLQNESKICRIAVDGFGGRDERYVHCDDLHLLDSLAGDAFEPRLSLIPPFDNLLYSQAGTKRLFGFDYIREQFLPKEKRKYGTYVLPIVWGENMIGRVDPRLDKESGTLHINAVYAERGAPVDREVAEALGETISRLGKFVGARRVVYSSRVPAGWKQSLH